MATGGFPKMTASLMDAGRGDLAHRFRVGGDTLVVVFSQVRVPAGKFGLERLFASTTHSLLLLNQPANDWYRSCGEDIDRLIGEGVTIAKAGRVILYGSSMGAFTLLRRISGLASRAASRRRLALLPGPTKPI